MCSLLSPSVTECRVLFVFCFSSARRQRIWGHIYQNNYQQRWSRRRQHARTHTLILTDKLLKEKLHRTEWDDFLIYSVSNLRAALHTWLSPSISESKEEISLDICERKDVCRFKVNNIYSCLSLCNQEVKTHVCLYLYLQINSKSKLLWHIQYVIKIYIIVLR